MKTIMALCTLITLSASTTTYCMLNCFKEPQVSDEASSWDRYMKAVYNKQITNKIVKNHGKTLKKLKPAQQYEQTKTLVTTHLKNQLQSTEIKAVTEKNIPQITKLIVDKINNRQTPETEQFDSWCFIL